MILPTDGPGIETFSHFEILLLLMVTVWGTGRIFKYFKLPPMLGEILSGVLLGPAVLGILPSTEVILILAELGVFFLMFHSGLDTNVRDFMAQAKLSMYLALASMTPIILMDLLVMHWWGYGWLTSFFTANVLALASVPVIVSVLKTYKLKNTRVGHMAKGATVVNEILLFVSLSIILSVANSGGISGIFALWVGVKVCLFFGIVLALGRVILPYLAPYVLNRSGSKGFTFALIVALLFAILAESIGLHFVVGAYLAGMFVREEITNNALMAKIEDRFYGLSHSFLGPIFFASVGMIISFDAFKTSPWLVLIFLFLVFAGQMCGAHLVGYLTGKLKLKQRFLTGALLSGRGSTEIIMAQIGFSTFIAANGERLISENLFGALVLLSFLSSLIMPLLVKFILSRDGQCSNA